MILYPAIDLAGGRVVRLWKGDFARETVYAEDPVTVAKHFRDQGATRLHVVDLDGARTGQPQQTELLRRIAGEGLALQVGGGLRSQAQAEALIEPGVSRVVLGSLALREPEVLERLLGTLGPERVVLAVDCRVDDDGVARILSHGWTREERTTVLELVERFASHGLQHVLCTDIDVDGTQEGPNLSLYERLLAANGSVQWLASGGVGSLADLGNLRRIGCAGAIVGRALYEGDFTLEEAFEQEAGSC